MSSNNEWRTCKWGDISTLEYGKALRNYKGNRVGYPVYGTNGLIGYTDSYLCNQPGVIVGRKGAYRGVHYSKSPFYVIDTAYYLKPKIKELDLSWAYYNLRNKDINNLDSGSAIPSTSRSDFYSLDVDLPELNEQKAIADLLSALDVKIELNNAINNNLEEMAQALFKRWFVDFEFPNEEGEPYKSGSGEFVESEFGDTPKDWSLKSIYDMASYINGASFKANELGEDGIPVIKIAELKGGITSQTKYFQGSEKDEKYYIKNGDILFSWSGNPETSIDTFIWYRGKGILNQHIFKVVPYNDNLKGFVYTLLKFMKSTFARLAGGKQTTGLGHVTVKDLQRLQIVFPDEVTLSIFSKAVDPLILQIYNNNIENEILSSTRDALLPKLMTGEIRVQVDREYSQTHKNDQPMAAESKEHYSIT